MPKKLGYLGPAGTFTEAAAIEYDSESTLVPLPSIPLVAESVRSGETDEGIIPIENSLEGAVTTTLDLLIQEKTLFIRQELAIPIEHCLLTSYAWTDDSIKLIYSHPQALGQCREFLERTFPEAQAIATLSTVTAVEEMKESKIPAAAIAPQRAAELYKVKIIAKGVQDFPNNVTRFVVLSSNEHSPTGNDKTSICFGFDTNRAGLLYDVMGDFAIRGINLTKVESRPTKEILGRYIFLVDLEGHKDDLAVRDALSAVALKTSSLKIFGSYPVFNETV